MKAAKSIQKDIRARRKADSKLSSAFSESYKAKIKENEIRLSLIVKEITEATNGKGILLENII